MILNTNVWPTINIWHIKLNATLNHMPIYRLRGRQLRDSDLRSNEVRGSTRANRTWANVSFGNADRRRRSSLPLPQNEETVVFAFPPFLELRKSSPLFSSSFPRIEETFVARRRRRRRPFGEGYHPCRPFHFSVGKQTIHKQRKQPKAKSKTRRRAR